LHVISFVKVQQKKVGIKPFKVYTKYHLLLEI